jgi:hypothetical protein
MCGACAIGFVASLQDLFNSELLIYSFYSGQRSIARRIQRSASGMCCYRRRRRRYGPPPSPPVGRVGPQQLTLLPTEMPRDSLR